MKRIYVFVGFLLLMGILGYPLVQELRHVSQVKESKSDFQSVIDREGNSPDPIRRESQAWDQLPAGQREQLRDLGFFPASLRTGSLGFELETFKGESVRLSHYNNRWVLLNFWATWCPPCRMEMPSLDQLQEQFSDQLRVVTVNVEQSRDTIRRFQSNYGFTLPILLDARGRVSKRYGVTGLPETWLLAPGGNPLAKLNGPLEWHNPPASTAFEELLKYR